MTLNSLFKEPLLHFLVVGGVLYLYYLSTTKTTQAIQIAPTFSKEVELFKDKLIRSACLLGIPKEDKIVSKHLIQKMLFILNAHTQKEPTQEELLTFFTKHQQEYAKVEKIEFYLYKPQQKQELKLLRDILNITNYPLKQTQHLFLTKQEIQKQFGHYMWVKLSMGGIGYWQILKDDTLVFIAKKQTQGKADFDEVQERVYKDFNTLKTIQRLQQNYKKL